MPCNWDLVSSEDNRRDWHDFYGGVIFKLRECLSPCWKGLLKILLGLKDNGRKLPISGRAVLVCRVLLPPAAWKPPWSSCHLGLAAAGHQVHSIKILCASEFLFPSLRVCVGPKGKLVKSDDLRLQRFLDIRTMNQALNKYPERADLHSSHWPGTLSSQTQWEVRISLKGNR